MSGKFDSFCLIQLGYKYGTCLMVETGPNLSGPARALYFQFLPWLQENVGPARARPEPGPFFLNIFRLSQFCFIHLFPVPRVFLLNL